MIQLAHGCYTSIKVYPANWDKPKASLAKEWKVYYRFHDPKFKEIYPDGKYVVTRGMNRFKTLSERRSATKIIIDQLEQLLIERDYNPITGYIRTEQRRQYVIDPELPVIDALEAAFEKIKCQPTTKIDIRSALKYFTKAIEQVHFENIVIKDFKRSYVKATLQQIGVIKGSKWSANNYNYHRAHISMLFKELVQWDAIEANPVTSISKEKVVKKLRKTLTLEERKVIDINLRKNNYRLWRWLQIFFHSGSRRTEIMKVRKEDVDLKNQLVKYIVLKGNKYQELVRPIKDIALPYWEQVMTEAKPGEYLFSKSLKPGPEAISPKQITRRWKLWVKKKHGIDADMYCLKHINSTETSELVGTALAAKHNAHTEAILKQAYDVKGKDRELAILKKINNSFA